MAYPIKTPSDLFAVIPHLVGHEIDDAYIVVGLHPGQAIHAIWFVDDTGPAALAKFCGVLRDVTLDEIVIVGYAPLHASTAALDALARVAGKAGITDVTCLVCHAGRYWDLGDPDCPAIGRPVEVSPELAARLAAGPAPAVDQDAVGDVLAPVTGDAQAAMAAATSKITTDPVVHRGLLARIDLEALVAADPAPDLDAAAEVLVAVSHSGEMFLAAMGITARDPHNSQRLWLHLVRHAEPDLRGVPALLAAYACQLTATGMLAHHAISIAEHLIPDHPLTHPVAAAIRSGRIPTVFAAGPDVFNPNEKER